MSSISFLDFSIDDDRFTNDFKQQQIQSLIVNSRDDIHDEYLFDSLNVSNTIVRNKSSLVIAVDSQDPSVQLGFCVFLFFDTECIMLIDMVQAFMNRRRVTTHLLDYVQNKTPHRMLIRDQQNRLQSFLKFYLEHNPRAFFDGYWARSGEVLAVGPILEYNTFMTMATFAVMLQDLQNKMNAKDVRPLNQPLGGIVVTAPFGDESLSFTLQFYRQQFVHWPDVPEDWIGLWSENKSQVAPLWAHGSSFILKEGQEHPFIDEELDDVFRQTLFSHGIEMRYFMIRYNLQRTTR